MGNRDEADEQDEFARAMRGVEPLEPPRRRDARRRREDRRGTSAAPVFDLVELPGRVEGKRVEMTEDLLVQLRRGQFRPADRLDLHGMTEDVARHEVYRFLRRSRASGLRCVALVHGRGLRSPAGPVLKQRLPAWLTQLPLAHDVLAFAAAPRPWGGDGVTLVLLAER